MANVYAYNEATKDLIYAASEEAWPEGYVTVDYEPSEFGAFDYASDVLTVTIRDSVTEIEDYAFRQFMGMTSVTIPTSVTAIGARAFSICNSLKSITIPNSVTVIGDGAFASCSILQDIDIPDSVTAIGASTFSSCQALETITIPNSVTTIGSNAFNFCESLKFITIPDSVTAIQTQAFQDCTALIFVDIRNSQATVASGAFQGAATLYDAETGEVASTFEGGHTYYAEPMLNVPNLLHVKKALDALKDYVNENGNSAIDLPLPVSQGGTGVTTEDALIQLVFNSSSTPQASDVQYGVVKFANDEDFKAYMGIS